MTDRTDIDQVTSDYPTPDIIAALDHVAARANRFGRRRLTRMNDRELVALAEAELQHLEDHESDPR